MIIFKKVRFKNFGSFGNKFTEINLTKNGTTLVTGSNGSGKSFALLDSITFALFGKPFRKINIPQLQNSINTKESVVEIFFQIGMDEYKIRRGLYPRLFEIYKNDILLNQDAKSSDYQDLLEKNILKMNYKTFTQVVILGSSSFVPFMQLSAADRRLVIENILDIDIFSTMNTLLKTKTSECKEQLRDITYKIENQKQKIEYQEIIIRKTRNNNPNNREDLVTEYNDKIAKIDNINQKIDSIRNKKNKIDLNKEQTLNKEIAKLNKMLIQLDSKEEMASDEINFYKEESVCPKCKGNITEETKEKNIVEIKEKISNIEEARSKFKLAVESLENELQEIQVLKNTNSVLDKEISELEKELYAYKVSADNLKDKLKENTTNDVEIEQEKLKLVEANIEYDKLLSTKEDKKKELINFELAYNLLKDGGVKSKIIKYYLPTMNKNINKYLKAMDFFVQFYLNEEFNELIKSRNRDEFSYMNFSEGEKMRIDLSLLLSWRDIARLKNSVNCNLLILDEVFDSSLDAGGTEEVMKLLNILGNNNSNVFVISHKADQIADKFTNILQFEKKNNFSKMVS
jgi:DNA repair exonuclease SbcCD ATPase subunit